MTVNSNGRNDRIWKRLRRKVLEANPYCYACGRWLDINADGRRSAGATVDHLNNDPHDNRPENLASCCKACNVRKQRALELAQRSVFTRRGPNPTSRQW